MLSSLNTHLHTPSIPRTIMMFSGRPECYTGKLCSIRCHHWFLVFCTLNCISNCVSLPIKSTNLTYELMFHTSWPFQGTFKDDFAPQSTELVAVLPFTPWVASNSPVPKGRTNLIKAKAVLTLHTWAIKNSSSQKHYWQHSWPVFLSFCNLVHILGRGIDNWSKFLLSSNSQSFLLLCHCKGFFHLFLGSFKILKLKHTILMPLRTKCSWIFSHTEVSSTQHMSGSLI